jgi:hypothetical protein
MTVVRRLRHAIAGGDCADRQGGVDGWRPALVAACGVLDIALAQADEHAMAA